jgi:hypothetical protein
VRCNGEALPGALQPGDRAVWDGHVAMVVDNGMTIEPMYQYGCRTSVVMSSPWPTDWRSGSTHASQRWL